MKKIECDCCGDKITSQEEATCARETSIPADTAWAHIDEKTIVLFKVGFTILEGDDPDLCQSCFEKETKKCFEAMMNPKPTSCISLGSEEDIPF